MISPASYEMPKSLNVHGYSSLLDLIRGRPILPIMFSRALCSFVERLEDAHKRLENDNITNTLSALSVESRTADMIRRLVYIRARLMKPSSRIEAKKQKIRAQRERRHIPGVVLKRQFKTKKKFYYYYYFFF